MHRKFTKIFLHTPKHLHNLLKYLLTLLLQILVMEHIEVLQRPSSFTGRIKYEKYNSLVKYENQMYDSIKHTMLENAVNGIFDLRAVKTQAAQYRAQLGKNITYEQYCASMLSAAQAYDAHIQRKQNHAVQDIVCTTVQLIINLHRMVLMVAMT